MLAATLIGVTYLATVPAALPVVATINDKVGHAGVFYVLGFLTDFAFPRLDRLILKLSPLLLYGLMIEVVQGRLPYRYFEFADLAADLIGLAGYGLSLPLLKRVPGLRARWS